MIARLRQANVPDRPAKIRVNPAYLRETTPRGWNALGIRHSREPVSLDVTQAKFIDVSLGGMGKGRTQKDS